MNNSTISMIIFFKKVSISTDTQAFLKAFQIVKITFFKNLFKLLLRVLKLKWNKFINDNKINNIIIFIF